MMTLDETVDRIWAILRLRPAIECGGSPTRTTALLCAEAGRALVQEGKATDPVTAGIAVMDDDLV